MRMVSVRTVGLGTWSLELRVCLSSVEHGGWVAGDLRGTLDIDPNPNGILPLHRPFNDYDLIGNPTEAAQCKAWNHQVSKSSI